MHMSSHCSFLFFLFKQATIHNLLISHDNSPLFTKNLEKTLILISSGYYNCPKTNPKQCFRILFCLFVFFGRGAYYGRCENKEFDTKFSNKMKSCTILISLLISCPPMYYVLTIDLVIWCMRKWCCLCWHGCQHICLKHGWIHAGVRVISFGHFSFLL